LVLDLSAGPGEPVARLAGRRELTIVDLTANPHAERRAAQQVEQWLAEPRALDDPELVRHLLFRLAPERHLLALLYHHVVLDGYAQGLHVTRIGQLYDAAVTGAPVPPARSSAVAEVVSQDLGYPDSRRSASDERYWAGVVERCAADDAAGSGWSTGPAGGSSAVLQHSLRLDAADRRLLRDCAGRHGWREPAVVMALVAAYQARLGHGAEPLSVPVPARVNPSALRTPTMLTNELPLLVPETGTLAELVPAVETALAGLVAHQGYRYEDVHRLAGLAATGRRLAPTAVNLVSFDATPHLAGCRVRAVHLASGPVHDLRLDIYLPPATPADPEPGATLVLCADGSRHRAEELEAHGERLLATWRTLLPEPATPLAEVAMLTAAEQALLAELARTDDGRGHGPYDPAATVVEAILARCADHAGEVAVSDELASWTYAELAGHARAVAGRLRALGVRPGEVVALHLDRSVWLAAAVLGTMLAGAAYLPLDVDQPAERSCFQLADAGAGVVLDDRATPWTGPGRTVTVDGAGTAVPAEAAAVSLPSADDPAYLLYTSGSSGRPKGVLVSHRALANRIWWMRDEYRVGDGDVVLQKTAYTFDVSVWELVLPLVTGARLHLARPGSHRDPRELARQAAAQRVSLLHFVPSMLEAFLDEPAADPGPALRAVFASGEALTPHLVGRFLGWRGERAIGLHNLYGPTEAAIDVTHHTCLPADANAGSVPIGRPVSHTGVQVLGRDGARLPVGYEGELCLSGVQLADGYLGRPELTAAAFPPDPRGPGRIYRTGDRAVIGPDGALRYRGRRDAQVKIRGQRVEIGEIEAVLAGCPAVRSVAVTVEPAGGGRLHAHVVAEAPDADPAAVAAAVTAHATRLLPAVMVPAGIAVHERLPMLASGKVDRRALAGLAVDVAAPASTGAARPRTPAEQALHEAWCEVLGHDEIDLRTTFAAAGGDSIAALRVRTALERRGLTFAVAQLFQTPTIAGLAATLRPATAGPERLRPFALLDPRDLADLPAGLDDAYPLTAMQSAIVFEYLNDPDSGIYRVVTSVEVALALDPELLRESLAWVQARHPALRSTVDLETFTEPLQLVHGEVPVHLSVAGELTGDPAERAAWLRGWAEQAKTTRFDLAAAPLVRFVVHPAAAGGFHLSAIEHHVALDGWSDAVLFDELVRHYAAALAGSRLTLAAPASSFADYVAAERRAREDAGSAAFWAAELADARPAPVPAPATAPAGPRHRRVEVPVEPRLAAAVTALARRLDVPVKTVLTAAHCAAQATATGSAQVCVGVVSHGRLEVEGGTGSIGVFLNTLPLALDLGRLDWHRLIESVRDHERRTFEHRRYPFGRIVRAQPDLTVQSYVNFMDFHATWAPGGQVVGGFGVAETDFDLAVNFLLDPITDRLGLWIDAATGAVEAGLLDRLGGYHLAALAAMTERLDGAALSDLRSAGERALAGSFDGPAVEIHPAGIDSAFRQQAARTPAATAVSDAGRSLSYAELDAEVQALADRLRAAGAAPGTLFGVSLRRSATLVTALLAVLRTGAAYVPLDPGYPAGRLAFIAADAGLGVVVADAGWDAVPGLRVVVPDGARGTPEPAGRAGADDGVAYVIYTSGSTGAPKGTVLTHANVANFFAGMDRAVGIGGGDTLLALTSVSFDISVLELLWPLARGGHVVVAGDRMIERLGDDDAGSLSALARRFDPTIVQATPSFYGALADYPQAAAGFTRLRSVLVGGEALPAGTADWLTGTFAPARVLNMYGPTETTIWSTCHELGPADLDTVPIGRPIANTAVRVVAETGLDAALGVSGELWIGGRGVARGYRDRPELTAERFVRTGDGRRWYRTGDRVRQRGDGVLEFLGRVDRQVKIRGHRIEPDEIESVLSTHPAVASVAVVPVARGAAGPELVAFVAPAAHAAEQLAAGHVEQWAEAWSDAYTPDGAGGDFDGWGSSYDSGPIPEEQMRDWLAHTIAEVTALGTRRVVDVGVGVGLVLRGVAPHCESYLGFDVSAAAVERARLAATAAGLPGARLEQGDALRLRELPAGSADLVVLNSVVQYFPSADYLHEVLTEAVRVAGPRGAVWIGDVRDLDLVEAFHTDVELARSPALATVAEVRRGVARRLAAERELCLSAEFFTGLADVGAVRSTLKPGRVANELTRFRRDVVLLGARHPLARRRWADVPELAWSELPGGALDSWSAAEPGAARVCGLADRRLTGPLAGVRALAEAGADETAWDVWRRRWLLVAERTEPVDDVDPHQALAVLRATGRAAWAVPAAGDPGRFDLLVAAAGDGPDDSGPDHSGGSSR
ncbi:MAG TPA: amino acid adenylation domain-containing protein, partial [Jatrophihabitans sp.]|nr:amino acid adenylation domain-containing protein [Jatrophihabitans sp.]